MKDIPCRHAIATILYKRFDVSAFVDKCYTKEAYLEAYSGSIPPLAGDRYWPKMNTTLLPPPIKLGPGRPRKNRRKSAHEDPKKPGKLTRHGLQIQIANIFNHVNNYVYLTSFMQGSMARSISSQTS